MKLLCDPASPFARRIIVTAIETGLDDRLDLVNPDEPETRPPADRFLAAAPVLVRDDGSEIVGTTPICSWLDSQHERPKLMPDKGEARLELDHLEAAADDLLEAAVSRYRELRRPEPLRWRRHAAEQEQRLARELDTLDSLAETVLTGPITLSHIAVGCALGWLDACLPSDDWRLGRPGLAAWYEGFRARPSMRAIEQPLP